VSVYYLTNEAVKTPFLSVPCEYYILRCLQTVTRTVLQLLMASCLFAGYETAAPVAAKPRGDSGAEGGLL
jgi:hypothetical protein